MKGSFSRYACTEARTRLRGQAVSLSEYRENVRMNEVNKVAGYRNSQIYAKLAKTSDRQWTALEMSGTGTDSFP